MCGTSQPTRKVRGWGFWPKVGKAYAQGRVAPGNEMTWEMSGYQCVCVFVSVCVCLSLSLPLPLSLFLPPLSQSLSVSEPFLPIPSTPYPCPTLPCSSPSIHLCFTAHHHCLFLHPQNSPSTPSDHRMLELSLSWLGLGPVAAFPWLLLLLVGASWILAHVLAWTYTSYNNSRRLRCFPQPPKRNWFLGHLGLVSVGSRLSLGNQGRRTSWRSGMGLRFELGSRTGKPRNRLFPHSFIPLLCH